MQERQSEEGFVPLQVLQLEGQLEQTFGIEVKTENPFIQVFTQVFK